MTNIEPRSAGTSVEVVVKVGMVDFDDKDEDGRRSPLQGWRLHRAKAKRKAPTDDI